MPARRPFAVARLRWLRMLPPVAALVSAAAGRGGGEVRRRLPQRRSTRPVAIPGAAADSIDQAGILATLPTGVLVCDSLGTIVFANPAFARTLGYRADELLGQPMSALSDATPEQTQAQWRQALTVLADGRTWSAEARLVRKDGTTLLDRCTASLLRLGDHRYLVSAHEDVTATQATEEALRERERERERQLRLLVENTTQVIFARDRAGRLRYINVAVEALAGYSVAELTAADDIDWTHPADREQVAAARRRFDETGQLVEIEHRVLTKQGQTKWVEVRWGPLRDEAGERIGVQGRQIDITARKQATEDLRRQAAILEAVGFAAERFLSTSDWQAAIGEVLARLGLAAEASSVRLSQNVRLDADGYHYVPAHHWVAPETDAGRLLAATAGQVGRLEHPDWWAATLGQGLTLNGTLAELPPWLAQRLARLGIRSFLSVPVFSGSAWWGAITFHECRSDRQWTAAEVDALKVAAGLLGSAIQRSSIKRDIERARHEADTLATITRDLSAAIQASDLVQRVVDSALGLTGSVRVSLSLRDPASDCFQVVASAGDGAATTIGVTHRQDEGLIALAVHEGVTVWSDDYPADPRASDGHRNRFASEGIRRVAAAPVSVDGRVEAVLHLLDGEQQPYHNSDIALIERLTGHVAVVLKSARLYHQIEERFARMQSLARMTHLISSSADVEEALAEITGAAAGLMDAPLAIFWLADEQTRTLEPRAFSSAVERDRHPLRQIAYGRSGVGVVAIERRPLVVADVRQDSRFQRLDWWETAGLRSFAAVPTIVNGELLGVLAVYGRQPLPIDVEQLSLLESFAAGVAVALHNARLFHAAEERVARLQTLTTINHLISSSLHLDEVLQAIARAAAQLTDAPLAAFWIVDEQAELLTLQAIADEGDQHDFPADRRSFGEGVSGGVARTRQPLHIADVRADRRIQHRDWWERRGFVSYYGLPVMLDGHLLAILTLNGRSAFTIGPDDQRLLDSFLAQAAIAIRNATTYRQLSAANADLERAVRQANELAVAAAEAARLKSEFLATMSHELRTPMVGVLGMADLLRDTPLAPNQRDYLAVIQSSGELLITLINDVLDFSKLDAGKVTLERIEVSPLALVEQTVDLLRANARQKGLTLNVLIAPDVPDLVTADPTRLRQVLLNLIGNALKFTEQGGVTVRCALTGAAGSSLTFSVADSGIGLSEAARRRLFQPFTQADGSTTRRYGGAGLGLSISKRLVELMGGAIGVDSQVGQGATFWFSLPCLPIERPAAQPTSRPVAGISALAGVSLLVVDDHPTSREVVASYARAAGARVQEAADGESALALLRLALTAGAPIQIVVTDLSMPGMDGLMLARAIRADAALAPTRLILMTAFDEHGQSEEALRRGFDAYLTKPLKRAVLLDVLSRAVTRDHTGAPVALLTPPPPRSERSANSDQFSQRDACILLVEDNPVNQRVASAQLERLGYTVEVAANGVEAVAAVGRGGHALVLMDCQMPVMDGYEATAAIRAAEVGTGRRLPIIALTANALQGDRERCLAAGMDDYLAKPFRPEALATLLDRWLAADHAPVSVVIEPVVAPVSEPPALADAVLATLREIVGDDTASIRELIGVYLAEAEPLLAEARAALTAGDGERLRRAAHALKGSSATIGLSAFADHCQRVEALGRAGDLADAPTMVAALVAAYHEVAAALRPVLGDRPQAAA